MAKKSIRLSAALLSAAATITALPTSAQAQVDQTYQFDLPAQDLGDALRAVAATASLQLFARAEDVNIVPAPKLHANLTARQAIERLLTGSGLIARFDNGAVVIQRRPRGANTGSNSDVSDRRDIIVTGTHIRNVVPTSEVVTTTRRQIEDQGQANLGEYIRDLPMNYSGGQNPGVAGGGDQGSGNENASSSSALNLRGLGADATLTLLNGHRLAYDTIGQGVDISQIPLAAINRIEIVPDGSSALYGSDAVGGVANVILRRDFKGALASARLSGATEGGDTEQQYDLVTGSRWKSGGIMLAASYSSATAITARQRKRAADIDGSTTLWPRQRQHSFVAAGHQDLSDGLTLEVDAQYNQRRSKTAAPSLTTSDAETNGLLSNSGVRSGTVSSILRWDVGGSWELTGSGTYGLSNNHIRSRSHVNGVERIRSILDYDNTLASVEFGAGGTLWRMAGGPVRVALGGGYRRAGLNVSIRQMTGAASNILADFDRANSVYFAYGELAVPLIGNANKLPLVEQLQFDVALRYEDYPGNSQLATPKIGLLYKPASSITLRASWGKSFKTQTLYQQYQPRQGVLLPGYLFGDSPSNLPVLLLAGGNPHLKPEKATTWSTGITIAVGRDLEIQATWFDVRYRDRVVEPVSHLLTVLADPAYADFVTVTPIASDVAAAIAGLPRGLVNQTGAPFDPAAVGAIIDDSLRNAARQHISGADLSVQYKHELDNDRSIRFDLSAAYLKSSQQLTKGFPRERLAGTIFNPAHWRGRAGVTWQEGNVTLSAVGNYIGGTTDDRYLSHTRVGSFSSVDLVGRVHSDDERGLFANTDLTITFRNLFNAKPDVIPNQIPTDPPYDSTNYPIVGRMIGVGVSKAIS